jgi:uncharacterized membrane protein YbhN (UPF0104 family)
MDVQVVTREKLEQLLRETEGNYVDRRAEIALIDAADKRATAVSALAGLKKLLRPSYLLPVILSASLLVALLAFGNVTRVTGIMHLFQPGYLLPILLLLVAYEAVQCLQWHVLVRPLGTHEPLRTQVFAFLVGAATRALPIGNFGQNYLLQRVGSTEFGLSSAATLLSVLIEVAVALAGLVILGLGPWIWLRPLILVGLAIFVPSAWAISRIQRQRMLPAWLTRQRMVRAALDQVMQFRVGASALMQPRVLVAAVPLGALYLLLGSSTLYLVLRGLSMDSVSWDHVLAVYFFSLAAGLILPLPIDIGVTEVGAVGAFLAIGVGKSDAVSAVLLLRMFTLGVAQVMALGTIAVLRREVGVVLGVRSRPRVLPLPVTAEASAGVD